MSNAPTPPRQSEVSDFSGSSDFLQGPSDETSSPSLLLDRPNWLALAKRLDHLTVFGKTSMVLAMSALAVVASYWFLSSRTEATLVLFFTVALFCGLFLSQTSGLIALLVGATCAKLLSSPFLSLKVIDQHEMLIFGLFAVAGSILIMASGALHRAFFELADRSERLRTAKEAITLSEREKDLLLHELSHRFQNELASLTSLLRLEASAAGDPKTSAALTSAANRVYMMARVNQRLDGKNSNSRVDLCPFAGELCADLRATLFVAHRIDLRFQCDSIQIPLAQAVTVGLILNELLTNAVKYAFPDDRHGAIDVRITRSSNTCSLVVADDGIGKGGVTAGSTGLGQRLMRALATQLGGVYTTNVTPHGRTCALEFPIVS